MQNTVTSLGHRAVVIGGSVAGLLAARVLSETYDEVVVVDRDRLGPYGDYRKGVQQARHAHGLLAGGLRAMEELLPGLADELIARGAASGDLQHDVTWVNEGRPLTSTATGLHGLLTSRLLLEDQLRTRVGAIDGVTIRDRADVLGLHLDTDGHVAGVRVSWRDDEESEEGHIDAGLVVDASGRGSRAPVWLQNLGYGTPGTDEIVVGLTYTTREFERPNADDTHSVVVASTIENPRAGVVLAQPEGRWVVTLGGYLGDAALGDLEGFRAFAATLPSSHVADRIASLTPIGEARTFKYRASTWRRYDRMKRLPEGFAVMGDAICSFNPIYGQGMTVAAREAVALRDILRTHGASAIGRRFARAAAREITAPWELAACSDLRFPAVQGRRTAKIAMVNRYLAHYFRAAEHDDELGHAFLEVLNLVAPPESLMSPRKMLRVLRRRPAHAPTPAPTGAIA